MSVVEIGSWRLRAGYAGDVGCTMSLPPLACDPVEATMPTNLHQHLLWRRRCGAAAVEAEEEEPLALWSLRSFQRRPEAHTSQLRQLRAALSVPPEDPLMLVVPEVWHERLEVMEALFEVILEEGGAPTLYCARPSVSWALSSGRASAVVVDVGHSHCTTSAVLDGYALRHTVAATNVGGAAVTAQFAEHMRHVVQPSLGQAYGLGLSEEDHIGRQMLLDDLAGDVKACAGFVATAAGTSANAAAPPMPPLRAPDGTPLELSTEARSAPFELFFREDQHVNVAEMTVRCKNRLDPEWQLHTVHHVLAGGSCSTRGFQDRFVEELQRMDSSYFRLAKDGAIQCAGSIDGAWVGASMAAASSAFHALWITRSEWEEEGSSCLHRKLFY